MGIRYGQTAGPSPSAPRAARMDGQPGGFRHGFDTYGRPGGSPVPGGSPRTGDPAGRPYGPRAVPTPAGRPGGSRYGLRPTRPGGSARRPGGKARGQVLVIFAVFILVAALLLMLSYFLYSAFRQKGAAEEIAHAAARAGCMQVKDRDGRPALDEGEVQEEVRRVLLLGLPFLPYGLAGGSRPQDVAESAEIYAVNAYPWDPRPSPFRPQDPPEKWYDRPFVAVRLNIPTKAFFAEVTIRVEVEEAVEMEEVLP